MIHNLRDNVMSTTCRYGYTFSLDLDTMARMSLSIDVEHEDESYRSPSPILLSPNQGGITLIQTSLNSPGSLDEDEVALSYLSEQDDLSKYKSKLSKLYSNKPLIM